MVLIDMELPNNCFDCPCCEGINGRCNADNERRFVYEYRPYWCPLKPFTPPKPQITTNIYDTEEIHHNCTVQVLRNSLTGEVSVGWWEEKEEEE